MKKNISYVLATVIPVIFILGLSYGIVLNDLMRNTNQHKYCKVKLN